MHRVRLVCILLLTLVVLAPAGAEQPPAYWILVSNDDGVEAPGLAAVAQILQAIGNVIVVAPQTNQSGKGHSITIADPIFRRELTLPNGLAAIGLTATPASTIRVALENIVRPPPDLVVTGINRGYNLGLSAYISGTVGGAREGAMHGIPSIAASLAVGSSGYAHAAEAVLGVARRVKQYGLPSRTFLNVNIPAGAPQGFQVTTQAMTPGGDERFAETKHPDGRTIYWNVYKEGGPGDQGTDMWAVGQGFVSVTPMHVGETDAKLPDQIRGWFR